MRRSGFIFDAIVISDIHLGSDNCQAKQLVHFLESVRKGPRTARKLILNGDVFDSIDFRRLKRQHWKVLSLLRKLSDDLDIVWINGNHDGPAEIVSHLLGLTVTDETVIESGGKRILFLHGHRFDQFISRYPLITWAADCIYNLLQRLDQSHYFAKLAKRKSKMFLRCAQKIETDSIAYAARNGCQAVCCGHTHHPVANTSGPVQYFNSGCWTEKPCHYLTVLNGVIQLETYSEAVPADALESSDAPASSVA